MSGIPASKPIGKIPEKILRLLGEPPVWRGEDREEYYAILLGIGTAIGATDIVDWVWANDIAYHVWDHRRLRRLQAALILNRQIQIIEELLSTTCDDNGPEDMSYYISGAKNDARRWATDLEFAKTIDERLAARGHDRASIESKAYLLCASEMQALDKAIGDRELRRMTALREIERRNQYLAQRLDVTSRQMIESQFSEAAE